MKKVFRRIARNKVGYWVLFVLLLIPIFPITIIGYIFYYLSKAFRSVGYLLLFKPHSALEEISDWRIWGNVRDFL
jgi:hypothetical protein